MKRFLPTRADVIAIVGFASLSRGLWQFRPALAYAVGGVLLMVYAFYTEK